jgi:hypothetical protein
VEDWRERFLGADNGEVPLGEEELEKGKEVKRGKGRKEVEAEVNGCRRGR